MMSSVHSLGISQRLRSALSEMGVDTPSPLQQRAIPVLLELDADVIVRYPEATESVFVYGPALIQRMDFDFNDIQALVLVPDSQRAEEVTELLGEFARYLSRLQVVCLSGGSASANSKRLRGGAHIVVSDGENLEKLVDQKLVDFSQVQICVVESEFFDASKNVSLFSRIIENLPGDFLLWAIDRDDPQSPVQREEYGRTIAIVLDERSSRGKDIIEIEHGYCIIRPQERANGVKRLIDAYPLWRGLIYCRTESDANYVYEQLREDGVNIDIYDGMSEISDVAWLVGTDFSGIEESYLSSANTLIHYGLPDEPDEFFERLKLIKDDGLHKRSLVIATLKDVERIQRLEKVYEISFEQRLLPDIDEIVNNNISGLADRLGSVHSGFLEGNPAFRELLSNLEKYSREEIVGKFIALEVRRYVNMYADDDFAIERDLSARKERESYKRLFINLGGMDGFDWRGIKDYIREKTGLPREEILNVDVKRKFSFFTVSCENAARITELMKEDFYQGRRISVEYSSNPDIDTLSNFI